jgi:predicted nucleic acid-binding protein
VVLVDTSVWIDFLNGVPTPETDWLDQQLPRQRLGVLDLVVCEVLQGVASETEAGIVLKELKRLEVFATGGMDLAVAAARNYRLLRRKGRTIRKTLDCLIATFCLVHGHALLHCDRDFDAFEKELGLKVVRCAPAA